MLGQGFTVVEVRGPHRAAQLPEIGPREAIKHADKDRSAKACRPGRMTEQESQVLFRERYERWCRVRGLEASDEESFGLFLEIEDPSSK